MHRHGAQLLDATSARFALWAPDARSVSVEIEQQPPVELLPDNDGWYTGTAPCQAGDRYHYRIDGKLHAHGLVRERRGFGTRRKLEGLMTGKIDLTYVRAERWYVLDYKSNRLPRYDAPALAAAMAHSEYDLQALVYTVALHRWLRFRLGDGYDYARDFGGIRYVFCRGLDAGRNDSPGIHAQRFPPELVDALDALFGHSDAQGVAA